MIASGLLKFRCWFHFFGNLCHRDVVPERHDSLHLLVLAGRQPVYLVDLLSESYLLAALCRYAYS